jgi:predicted ATPase
LDDLQRADSASLKLIHLLICDPDSQYILLMGAYRDNEVSPTHPLRLTLDEIQKNGAVVNNITLRPLDIGNVSLLVADTLKESSALRNRVSELSELHFNKTQDNPFFLTQMFATLHQEKLLTFEFSAGCGQWSWRCTIVVCYRESLSRNKNILARNKHGFMLPEIND